MAKMLAQLEFRWPAWMRKEKPSSRPRKTRDAGDDKDDGLTAWCRDMAENLALPELARRVAVSWNPRMRTTAGRAWWPARRIELNAKLREFPEEELWRTLKHELAHLVAYERAGRRRIDPHGREWQMACAEIGIPGEKTFHTLPLKGRRLKRKHAYVCPSCLTSIHRVKPIKKAVACYSCCRKFNSGLYHDRFRLIENKLP